MSQIILYSAISSLSLLAGATFGQIFRLKKTTIARFMAFGAGVLICALTFGLMEEAFTHGGFDAVIIGFLTGGIVFIIGDYIIHLKGGRHHHRHKYEDQNNSNGLAITLGAMLDGVPESAALGIALFTSKSAGLLMMAAIALSNFPEAVSSISGLRARGYRSKNIYYTWFGVALLTFVVAIFSYYFLNGIAANTIGILEAFAAGAILAMLADSMMPEAYEEGGPSIGFLTILGFLTAFIISRY